jgi:hypothetical protein
VARLLVEGGDARDRAERPLVATVRCADDRLRWRSSFGAIDDLLAGVPAEEAGTGRRRSGDDGDERDYGSTTPQHDPRL